MTKKSILQERVKNVLDKRCIDKSHYSFYLESLQPEAIENQDQITDEFILNSIIVKELFWGLGKILLNYVKLEREQ